MKKEMIEKSVISHEDKADFYAYKISQIEKNFDVLNSSDEVRENINNFLFTTFFLANVIETGASLLTSQSSSLLDALDTSLTGTVIGTLISKAVLDFMLNRKVKKIDNIDLDDMAMELYNYKELYKGKLDQMFYDFIETEKEDDNYSSKQLIKK